MKFIRERMNFFARDDKGEYSVEDRLSVTDEHSNCAVASESLRMEGKVEPRKYLAWQATHAHEPNFSCAGNVRESEIRWLVINECYGGVTPIIAA